MCPPHTDRRPVSSPVPSFWLSNAHSHDTHRSSRDLPSSADVVIIGGGFSGISTAYHLIKDNPNPPSIVLLEARTICSGATGRNGGHIKPDTYFNVPRNAKMHGIDAAAELAAFEAANVYAMKDLVESEELDCDFHLTRAVDVYLDREHAKQTEAAYRRLVESGAVNLDDTAFISERDAERVSGVKGACCAFTFTAAHLWPAKMVHGILKKLLSQNLNVQTHTPVTSVSSSRDNLGRWIIKTPRGDIRSESVVYATNGYTSQILGEYTRSITPIRGICSHIASPKKKNTPHLVNTYAIRFDSRNFDYLIPRADGSIIVGGAGQRFWHRPDRWFSTVRDDELIDEAVSYFDGYMQRNFRGWSESEAKTDMIWTGIMGYSADYMPHVGQVPDKPGQFIVAGFNGHGMPQILMSTKGLARMILQGVAFEQTGLPRMFKTTKERIHSENSPLEDSFRPLWEQNEKPRL